MPWSDAQADAGLAIHVHEPSRQSRPDVEAGWVKLPVRSCWTATRMRTISPMAAFEPVALASDEEMMPAVMAGVTRVSSDSTAASLSLAARRRRRTRERAVLPCGPKHVFEIGAGEGGPVQFHPRWLGPAGPADRWAGKDGRDRV